jgi:hypothetical protein
MIGFLGLMAIFLMNEGFLGVLAELGESVHWESSLYDSNK